jgi:hypothetical protein
VNEGSKNAKTVVLSSGAFTNLQQPTHLACAISSSFSLAINPSMLSICAS